MQFVIKDADGETQQIEADNVEVTVAGALRLTNVGTKSGTGPDVVAHYEPRRWQWYRRIVAEPAAPPE